MDLCEFYAWEATTRDTIDFKKIYVDITGDLIAGLLLSQIVFWFLPDKQGKTKLRVEKEGRMWLVKKREDWWEEIRITPKQFDRAIQLLEKKGLIECKLFRFDGSPQKHISLCIEALLSQLSDKLAFMPYPDWIFPKGKNPFSPKGKIHFDERVKTLTETTTETTTERDTSSSHSAPTTTTKPKKVFTEDTIEFRLANCLREQILQNLPTARVPLGTVKGLAGWASDIDRMIRIDKRQPEEIEHMIKWAQHNEFWRSNILSAKKLREKWDTLVLQAKREGKAFEPTKKDYSFRRTSEPKRDFLVGL